MTLHKTVIGCDISKAQLDIFDSRSGKFYAVDNDKQAITKWVDHLRTRQTLVVFEATGGYDNLLRQVLEIDKIGYARVNPARARNFARAAGVLAKTDRLDAQVLAEMGKRMALQPDAVSSPQRLKIAALSTRRDQLVATRKQEKTRIHLLTTGRIRRSLERHIDWLNREIVKLDEAIASAITASEQISKQVKLLTSIPGIGRVVATILVALMPELGTRSRRTIAALAGLAPINHDSGRYRGQRRIRGGRRRVREALYMAALSASQSCPRFAAFYQERLKNNPKAKPALIAVARKILIIANAVLREHKPFTV
jgi:transposase